MAVSVLLDTNLLILYAVGLASPDYIVGHRRLGLADAVTIDAIGSGAVLVTDDAPLYDAALRAGGQAELFSHHLVAAGLR
jgi:hypothetical protein